MTLALNRNGTVEKTGPLYLFNDSQPISTLKQKTLEKKFLVRQQEFLAMKKMSTEPATCLGFISSGLFT